MFLLFFLIFIICCLAEEAYDIFNEIVDDLPLPEGEYMDGSFQMSPMDDMTPEEYIEFATENFVW